MLRASNDHLAEVQETYLEHLGAALAISGALAKAAAACALHAFVPGLCTRTASRCIAQIYFDMIKRTSGKELGNRSSAVTIAGSQLPVPTWNKRGGG